MEKLKEIIESPELIEVGRKAIEDELIEMRDSRIGILNRGNGLVVRERDGSPSDIIRLGTDHALLIGFKAILKHMENTK